MMRSIMGLLIAVTMVVAQKLPPKPLMPFELDGKWGYSDLEGKTVIKPQYRMATEFTAGGIAAVATDETWYYINQEGTVVIEPFLYDNGPDYFKEGLARFVTSGKFGYFDSTGTVKIKPQFDFAGPFAEGHAVICRGCKKSCECEHASYEGGTWGFINKSGKITVRPEYEMAHDFVNGKARVVRNGKTILIGYNGEIVAAVPQPSPSTVSRPKSPEKPEPPPAPVRTKPRAAKPKQTGI